jgi:hypothetical protein
MKIGERRPGNLETLRRRLDRWRRTRKPGAGIPEALWSAAVKLAGMHGISRTATALRLDYYSLKKRLERQPASGQESANPARSGASAAPFWELAPAPGIGVVPPAHLGECTLELADAAGNTLRLQLRGAALPDLAALNRSFWNPAS